MHGSQIAKAADDVARQVAESMQGLGANLDPGEVVYAYALVVPDDFAAVMGYVNTTRFFATRPGGPTDRSKWYFGNWFGVARDVRMTWSGRTGR